MTVAEPIYRKNLCKVGVATAGYPSVDSSQIYALRS